jgi:leader peptidase (prepilin peptidase)/N-methyltransferase
VDTFIIIWAFAIGTFVGSFLNVCIYRIPRKCLSIWKPLFSMCPSCLKTIRWYDNIPLLSYMALRGRCRFCGAKIAFRYFVVEALTGFLFALVASRYLAEGGWSGPLAITYAAFIAALIVCTFIDIDFRIIPDAVDLKGIVAAPLLSLLIPAMHERDLPDVLGLLHRLSVRNESVLEVASSTHIRSLVASLFGIFVGAGIIYAIGVLGKIVFRKEAMGFGDVKFMGMIGGFLGWKGVIIGLLLACVLGALLGILIKFSTKESYIPFGPFLSLGALITLLYREEVVYFAFVIWPGFLRSLTS